MKRVVTPNSSSFDKIEAARRHHSQVEQEVSGLGRSPNSRAGGLAPRELPCGRYGARASYLFIDLPGSQDLVSSRLWFATLGNKLRKPTCLGTAPADLMKHAAESTTLVVVEPGAHRSSVRKPNRAPIRHQVG